MQKYHRQLIVFALCITITYAQLKINSFKDTSPDTDGQRSTVYATHVQLWANVTECLAPCDCKVKMNGSSDESQQVEFRKEPLNVVGSVTFSDLKPNTNYSFVLTCIQGQSSTSELLNIITDYGRPAAPKNLSASKASDHIQITWSRPSIANDSFNSYQIYIDKELFEPNVLKTETSYNITKELKNGIHILNMATCYKTKQGTSICSEKSDAEAYFDLSTTTTLAIPTTATTTAAAAAAVTTSASIPKSSGVTSYSFSLSIILSFLFLLSKI